RFAICHAVVLSFQPLPDAHEHMRTIRRNSRNRRYATEQQDAIGARIGYVWKALEGLANLNQRSGEAAQVTTILILDSAGDLHWTRRPQFRDHPARFQCPCQFCGASLEELERPDADLSPQRLPSFCAGGVAGRISAVPPHQEMVRVGRPAWLLVAIMSLQPVKIPARPRS